MDRYAQFQQQRPPAPSFGGMFTRTPMTDLAVRTKPQSPMPLPPSPGGAYGSTSPRRLADSLKKPEPLPDPSTMDPLAVPDAGLGIQSQTLPTPVTDVAASGGFGPAALQGDLYADFQNSYALGQSMFAPPAPVAPGAIPPLPGMPPDPAAAQPRYLQAQPSPVMRPPATSPQEAQARTLFPRATAFRDTLRVARDKAMRPVPKAPQPPQLAKG